MLSLRQFSRQHKVSINTAKTCYELLEAKGFIYAVSKSGYFVQNIKRLKTLSNSKLPCHYDFFPHVQEVSHLDLQIQIQESATKKKLAQLGSIQLSPDLIPIASLKQSMLRAIKNSKAEDFLYSNRQGHILLREALSDHWAEDGFYIEPEYIYISNGCMPALSVIVQRLTQVGESIIVPTPCYNGQLQLLALLKRKIVEIPASSEGFDLERLEQAMQHSGAKVCLLTANYQNPLGFCLTNQEKEKIAKLATKYQCYVIEDDIYAECCFDNLRPLPIKYWDEKGYVIYCGSISKTVSPAYRIGWFCIPSRLANLHAKLITQNINVNTPLQLGLADLIYSRAYRQHLNILRPKLLKQLEEYRHFISEAFKDISFGLTNPQGGYILWLQFPEKIDSWEMYCFAQQQEINIVPGLVFGAGNRYNNCIRINAGHPLSDEIKQAIYILTDWLKQQLKS
ncbi:hypothetical protein F925_00089 [Acinetobacter lwoffii NCTC 5866 = CIP 64.10 = NIPH 512]|nr:hypothetical protein F925_00089 [Acinetobacter lwoffii NCTC 5866 = CIP 64.10 = NIPH 512]